MLDKRVYAALWCAVLVLALALRLPNLQHRPMHTDEAVHAVKFAGLLHSGEYRYDSNEYHGPSLYYFTLLPAWMRGQQTLADLDEKTLRIIPVVFGLGLVLLPLLLVPLTGRLAALAAALWIAVSSPQVFYSRYYIHEVIFVYFSMLLIAALLRYRHERHWSWMLVAGASLGCLHASKETDLLILAAALAAFVVLCRGKIRLPSLLHGGIFWGTAFFLSLAFFSSFFANPAGLVDSLRTYTTYFARGAGDTLHIHPWYYYFQLLFWHPTVGRYIVTEFWIIPFVLVAVVRAFRRNAGGYARLVRFFTLFTGFLAVVYSALPYKTPWNALVFQYGLLVLAGIGAAEMANWAKKKMRVAMVYSLVALFWIAAQSIWLNYYHDSDARSPWVYAHPGPEVNLLSQRVEGAARLGPAGLDTPVEVIYPGHDYWPLPWTLRRLHRVGWYDQVDLTAPAGEIVLVAPALESSLLQKLYEVPPPGAKHLYVRLWDGYVELRPAAEIRAYIRKDLFDSVEEQSTP